MLRGSIDSFHDDTITFPIDKSDNSLLSKFWMFAFDDLDCVAAEDVPFCFFGGFTDLRFDFFSFRECCLHEVFHYLCSSCHFIIEGLMLIGLTTVCLVLWRCYTSWSSLFMYSTVFLSSL